VHAWPPAVAGRSSSAAGRGVASDFRRSGVVGRTRAQQQAPAYHHVTRRARLSRSRDFDAAYRKGRSAASRSLVAYTFHRDGDDDEEDDAVRLGLAVPRRVGDAVARNRVKRKLREAFAACSSEIAAAHDVVIVARPGLVETLDRESQEWLTAELRELLARTLTASDRAA